MATKTSTLNIRRKLVINVPWEMPFEGTSVSALPILGITS